MERAMDKVSKLTEGDVAYQTHARILELTAGMGYTIFELGKLFKQIRDEKLYKYLDASTFSEYCGFPEVKFARPTVYSFIKIYERYILKLGRSEVELLGDGTPKSNGVGHRSLQIINPVVEDNPDEWIEKAKVLSESDLINEVRIAQGKAIMKPKEKEHVDVYPFDFESYIDYVRSCGCLVCGNPSEPHHFPKTKGAGGREQDVIPLCRKHHNEADDAFDFLVLYKGKIFEYFYNMFLTCFEIINGEKNEKTRA